MRAEDAAARFVLGPDRTPIAVFESGRETGPPVVLIHGAAADHTTFRVVGPLLAHDYRIHAIDRRGRGASGDGDPAAYAIEREFADVALVVDDIAARAGRSVDVIGHSLGGRIALGATFLTGAVRRVVCYEGAPGAPGRPYQAPGVEERLESLIKAGDSDSALTVFMRDIVGMRDDDLAAYRADPVWPARVAAAPTLLREVRGERSAPASLDALSAVRVPVLQILGGDSPAPFRDATAALDERLADGRVVVIPGARHAAHHTHPDAFVAAVTGFLVG